MADAKKSQYEVTEEMYNNAVFEQGGSLVIDLGGIQEAKFEVVPKGIYPAEIDSVEFGMSNNSGAPMWTVVCMISEGQYQGRKLTTYISFSPKALPFSKATIARIAPELASTRFNPEQVADSGVLVGKQVRIRVAVEEYQGENRSKISNLMGPANAGPAGASPAAGANKGFF